MRSRALPGLAACCVVACASAGTPRPPNVIIFNTDDHAQWAVGAYGNQDILTPNMDRLAREGMKFTRAFSKPVCSPSRAMTLTGQYSHRLGIPDYIPYGNPVFADNGLPAGTPTIASVLRTVGYTSALIGKWHLGYGENYYPERYGFEVAEGHPYVAPGRKYDSLAAVPSLVAGQVVTGFRSKRQTDLLTDRAIHFVRENRAKPFFLFFNPFVTHQSYWGTAPDEDIAPYREQPLAVPRLPPAPEVNLRAPGLRRVLRTYHGRGIEEAYASDEEELRKLMRIYYGHITCADRNLGRLLATLDELQLSDHTLFLFMADNGMNLGQLALIGKGNASILGAAPPIRRSNMFDRSVLVPFIVRWPGVVRAGTTSDALVSTLDILPTLLAETGARADPPLPLDGHSLSPLLRERRAVPWRDFYCDTYDMIYLGNHGEQPHLRMIRTDRWKLVLHLDPAGNPLDRGRRHELFDLARDPDEMTNLYGAASVANVQHSLDAQLRAWMRATGVTPSQ